MRCELVGLLASVSLNHIMHALPDELSSQEVV